MEDRLVIGRIRASHGVRGEVKVQSLSGEDRHFHRIKTVWLRLENRERQLTVLSVRGALPNLILAFEGISSPEEARKYRGAEILVKRDEAAALKTGEYYIADLIGCHIVYRDEVLGEVLSVWENSNCDMFEVQCTDGHKVQVPFQDEFVGDVDTSNRRIELKVDWILE
jgi:16S rRNA processing protein RimM